VTEPDASALIIRVHLPAALERLRRASVDDAALGVPAHVTLLYPFIPAADLKSALRARIANVVEPHAHFDYHLHGPKAWPDTIYAALDPEAPFLQLHRELQAAFPDFPIYGGAVSEFVPHVTIAEGSAVGDPATLTDRAWHALPTRRMAHAVELMAPGSNGRWSTVWRFRLRPVD
jgi:2'-5' RNA ligase